MTIALKLKKGSTLTRKCTYSSGGLPVNLTGMTIRSSVRDKALVLIQELTTALGVQSGATLGTFTLSATAVQTATWPVGPLVCDFRIVDSLGAVTHSESFYLQLENAITQ